MFLCKNGFGLMAHDYILTIASIYRVEQKTPFSLSLDIVTYTTIHSHIRCMLNSRIIFAILKKQSSLKELGNIPDMPIWNNSDSISGQLNGVPKPLKPAYGITKCIEIFRLISLLWSMVLEFRNLGIQNTSLVSSSCSTHTKDIPRYPISMMTTSENLCSWVSIP